MSKPPPKPIFTFFGVDGGATCSCVEKQELFVGSQRGVVRSFGLESKILEQIVYSDGQERRIQSLEFSEDSLFVQIRAFAVIKLQKSKDTTWKIIDSIDVNHIGFCNSILIGRQLLFVSSDEKRQPTLCWTYLDLKEKIGWKRIMEEADITPMCLTIGEEKEREVLIGMEDGRMAICYGDEEGGFECQATQKLGREPIFCIASSSKWVAAGCARSPIFLIDRGDLSKKEIRYPPDSAGCSSITFSPNQKQILAGFWDGTIRVFSRQKLSILLVLSSTHTSNIGSLHWLPPENGELVIATSSDSTISLWKLK
uniref:WD_REPEATS_REGION domain-containing protein n=1 Tax=Caenorhabditis tropicalis TaxID=1561998 RepID=A0A1I7THD3_9PELO